MSKVTFKIKATTLNVNHTRSFTPAYDGSMDAYHVGTAIATVGEKWIEFEVGNPTAAYLNTGQANKQGFLKQYGF